MSKTNILFNDKNYLIDTSSLSAQTAYLKSHLSTTMNGSGAAVIFDGVSYNVDLEKLEAATNKLVAYIRTIAGNGYKVSVDGVEYDINSIKVQDAIIELETVLGHLNNQTTDEDGVRLLSLDNLALKDFNGLLLFAKEGE